MPRLRPEMEILHVNGCVGTCRVHQQTGRKVSSSCPQSILGMLFCSKGAEARSSGHRGYKSLQSGRSAEYRPQAIREKKSQPSSKALTMSRSALFLYAKLVYVSGALKFGIAAQLGTMEPEGEIGSGAVHQMGQQKWSPGPCSPAGKCEAGSFSVLPGGLLMSQQACWSQNPQ